MQLNWWFIRLGDSILMLFSSSFETDFGLLLMLYTRFTELLISDFYLLSSSYFLIAFTKYVIFANVSWIYSNYIIGISKTPSYRLFESRKGIIL